jgi:hypothetical protein
MSPKANGQTQRTPGFEESQQTPNGHNGQMSENTRSSQRTAKDPQRTARATDTTDVFNKTVGAGPTPTWDELLGPRQERDYSDEPF